MINNIIPNAKMLNLTIEFIDYSEIRFASLLFLISTFIFSTSV
jgi:hypothetical protein